MMTFSKNTGWPSDVDDRRWPRLCASKASPKLPALILLGDVATFIGRRHFADTCIEPAAHNNWSAPSIAGLRNLADLDQLQAPGPALVGFGDCGGCNFTRFSTLRAVPHQKAC
jgi:hypothetical protein